MFCFLKRDPPGGTVGKIEKMDWIEEDRNEKQSGKPSVQIGQVVRFLGSVDEDRTKYHTHIHHV